MSVLLLAFVFSSLSNLSVLGSFSLTAFQMGHGSFSALGLELKHRFFMNLPYFGLELTPAALLILRPVCSNWN